MFNQGWLSERKMTSRVALEYLQPDGHELCLTLSDDDSWKLYSTAYLGDEYLRRQPGLMNGIKLDILTPGNHGYTIQESFSPSISRI
jgi:hypothetical protein